MGLLVSTEIDFGDQQLTILPSKIDYNNLISINISCNLLTNIDILSRCKQLRLLNCNANKLTSLNNLPTTLKELYCAYNQLTTLNNLPTSLQILFCNDNKLTSLNMLPINLEALYCENNKLTTLNSLPTSLQILICSYNQLTSLDKLPTSLQTLYCDCNLLTSLDQLPTTTQKLYCMYNKLKYTDLCTWKHISAITKVITIFVSILQPVTRRVKTQQVQYALLALKGFSQYQYNNNIVEEIAQWL